MQRAIATLPPLRQPALVILLLLGASSIASLLLYFYGSITMGESIRYMVLPAVVVLPFVLLWAYQTGRHDLYARCLAGLWAGAWATLAYDVVRVPIAWSGVPVFKAISYFGTVITSQTTPTMVSEVAGWTYHLSNGMGFGLMYTALMPRPHWWSAVFWGLLLEGVMLVTPYAEVFGYKVSPAFLTITIGAHVVYGVTLWIALRYGFGSAMKVWAPQRPLLRLLLASSLVPIGIGAIAADFHRRYSATLPPSPPVYLGAHLYTTWNVLEPDRLVAMWVLQRFIDPQARFHWVPPFSPLTYGRPFDTPEAVIRRSGTQSATEVLLAQNALQHDRRLARLAHMTHLYEITPWMRPADLAATQLGQDLLAATGPCTPQEIARCIERAFHYLNTWYSHASSAQEPEPGKP